jgi:hypothetical protein
MTWFYYLLEANLYLIIFYGFYRFFLQNETFYGLNRGYLISSSIFSFIIPFLQVGNFNQLIYGGKNLHLIYIDPKLEKIQSGEFYVMSMGKFAMILYLLIASLIFIKLIISLYKIILLATTAKREKLGNIIFVELTGSVTAFSFFNLLFINPLSAKKNTIVSHEMVHIRQKHSLDIMFFELFKIINWFNPIVWMIQRDIKLIHEYIVDDIITDANVEKREYAMFLIENSFGVQPISLTNQIFNQSILKQRIIMLNKKRSAARARLRVLLAVPIVFSMLFASTVAFTKDYATVDLYPQRHSVNVSKAAYVKPSQEPKIQTTRFFTLNHKIDYKSERVLKYDTRLVVINEKISSGIIVQVEGFDKMVELKGKEATDKYGSRAADGALIFTGKNVKTLGLDHVIRFPPPIVVKNKH